MSDVLLELLLVEPWLVGENQAVSEEILLQKISKIWFRKMHSLLIDLWRDSTSWLCRGLPWVFDVFLTFLLAWFNMKVKRNVVWDWQVLVTSEDRTLNCPEFVESENKWRKSRHGRRFQPPITKLLILETMSCVNNLTSMLSSRIGYHQQAHWVRLVQWLWTMPGVSGFASENQAVMDVLVLPGWWE